MADEQKVRIGPGTTGPVMFATNDAKGNSGASHSYAEYEPGLEVVETGPQAVDEHHLPEFVGHHTPKYAEYKQYSPLQPAFSHPASVGSGSPPDLAQRLPSPRIGGPLGGYHYTGGHNPFLPAEKRRDGTVCGLRKKAFWVVLAVVITGMVVAIAVGLGVGMGIRTGSSHSANATSSSTPATETSTAFTGTIPAATATATADSSTDIVCPYANRTVYTLDTNSVSKGFLVLCGRDYNAAGGAFDISSMNMSTFEGCLNECGETEDCVGVGWGNYYNVNTCWLKSYLGVPNAAASWYAAVLVDSG